MASGRTIVCLALLGVIVSAVPADAQIIDRIRKKVDETKEAVTSVRDIDCEVRGKCGEIRQSELFTPAQYNSLAVTVYDASNRYRAMNLDGLVRGPFEGQLLENRFLLAASSDADAVRELIGRSKDAWSDDALAQLKEFVNGIDAVLLVQIDDVAVGQCVHEGKVGSEVTAYISARFVNVDAGDIPWVGLHKATVCEDGGASALSAALEKVTTQLAGSLPVIE